MEIHPCLSDQLQSHFTSHPQMPTAEQESVQAPELHLALYFNETKKYLQHLHSGQTFQNYI